MLKAKVIRTDAGLQDRVHVPLVAASLALGTLGGFVLAVTLPTVAASGGMDARWVAQAQVHGHLQVVGFAGIFVLAMALRVAPRFAQRPQAHPRLVLPALALLVAGLLLRALGQPFVDQPGFEALLVAGALAEVLALAAFAAVLWTTLRPALLRGDPSSLLLSAAVFWMVVQAVLGAWWLTELARGAGVILEQRRNALLVNLQFFGVLLSAILGVGLRSFPMLFGLQRTPPAAGRAVFIALQVGLLLWLAGALAGLAGPPGATAGRLQGLGLAGMGLTTGAAVATFGVRRLALRGLGAGSGPPRGLALSLMTVLAWLVVTAAGLAWVGGHAALEGTLAAREVDAVRHVFALGVVSLAIVTMAQVMLPEFASERVLRPPPAWRAAAFAAVLSLAAVLRGGVPLTGLDADVYYGAMALAGVLALAAVTWFALLYVRARRWHVAYTSRVAAARPGGQALPVVSRRG